MSYDDIDPVAQARTKEYFLKCKIVIVNKVVDQVREKLGYKKEARNIDQVFLIPEATSQQQAFISAWIKTSAIDGVDYDMDEPCEVIVTCGHPIFKPVRMLTCKPSAECFNYHLRLMTVATKDGSDELDILNAFKAKDGQFVVVTVHSQDDEETRFSNV